MHSKRHSHIGNRPVERFFFANFVVSRAGVGWGHCDASYKVIRLQDVLSHHVLVGTNEEIFQPHLTLALWGCNLDPGIKGDQRNGKPGGMHNRTGPIIKDRMIIIFAILSETIIHRRPVDLPRLASNVGDDAEAGKPACE